MYGRGTSCERGYPATRRISTLPQKVRYNVLSLALLLSSTLLTFFTSSTHHSNFISHRTHRQEDLGVDHIFFRPEMIVQEDIPISEQYLLSPSSTPCLYVSETAVLPKKVPCSFWPEDFQISDHRPVRAKMVFAKE